MQTDPTTDPVHAVYVCSSYRMFTVSIYKREYKNNILREG